MYHIHAVTLVLFTMNSLLVAQHNPEGHLPIKLPNKANTSREESNTSKEKNPIIDLKQELKPNKLKTNSSLVTTNIASKETENLNAPESPKSFDKPEEKLPIEESGAIKRAVMVFIGISFFFILYVGLQTFRRKKKQDKSRTIVKRYGVRTNRSDLEMEPLPLSDDDEDDTIFDLNASRG